ncbi:Warthog protein 5 [Aphelenchoides fujianensis]|nr:Warthog protein 5 [Aphelenchoides fujianensis]
MKPRWRSAAVFLPLVTFFRFCSASSCGNNKVPYGIEVYRNGQPVFLCSKPNCFEKTYADCDERALQSACHAKDGWVGGLDKSYGEHQPLYVQCCEYEEFERLSDPIHTHVLIHAGEYFEGEEIMDKYNEDVIAFDMVTNVTQVRDANSTLAYRIDVRRFRCADMKRPKPFRPWSWP